MRRKAFRKPVQNRAARTGGTADGVGSPSIALRCSAVSIFSSPATGFVKARRVADLQRIDRVPTEIEPVSKLRHGSDYGDCGRAFSCFRGRNASRVGYAGPVVDHAIFGD